MIYCDAVYYELSTVGTGVTYEGLTVLFFLGRWTCSVQFLTNLSHLCNAYVSPIYAIAPDNYGELPVRAPADPANGPPDIRSPRDSVKRKNHATR